MVAIKKPPTGRPTNFRGLLSTTKYLSSAYDKIAPFYDCLWRGFEQLVLSLLERELFPYLSAGDEIIDLGCGTGLLARELISRGYSVTAVDQSKGMLREAAKNAPRAR